MLISHLYIHFLIITMQSNLKNKINFLNLKQAYSELPEPDKKLFLTKTVPNLAKSALLIQTEFPDYIPILIAGENA